jgi:CRP-like cAMP-binding protein
MKEIGELYDQIIVLKRNEFLKVGGTIDTNIYLVKNGSLKIYILDQENEHIIRFGYDQDLIVSLDSFLTEQASDFFIQALKKTVIHRISKNKFLEFIN